MKNTMQIYTGLLLAIIFWGMSFVWVDQLLLSGFPPYNLLAIRLSISAIVLLFITVGLGKFQLPKRADLPWIILMATFEPFLYFIGETKGIQLTTPTTASVIVSTIPLFAMLLSFLVYREKISKLNISGAVIAVAGVVLSLSDEKMSIKIDLWGALMLFLAVFSAVGYSLVVKKLTAKYNTFSVVIYQNILGALMFIPFSFQEYGAFSSFIFSFGNIYPLFLLALLPSTLSFLFYVNSIHCIGVARANMFSTLIPVITMLFSATIGREILNQRNITGVLIVITGLLLSQLRTKSAN